MTIRHRIAALVALFCIGLLLWGSASHADTTVAGGSGEYGAYRVKLAGFLVRADALREQIDAIFIDKEYCEGDASLAQIRTELAQIGEQLRALQAEYSAANQDLSAKASSHGGVSGLPIDEKMTPDNPNFFHGSDDMMRAVAKALEAKEAQLAAARVKACPPPEPKKDGGIDDGPVAPGETPMPDLPPAPPGPNLDPLALPDHFCSQQEWESFRFDVMWPFVSAARSQAVAWSEYSYATSKLRAQYSDDPKLYPILMKIDNDAEANARKARDFADSVENTLPGKMGRIPVIDCRKPVPETPPPGGVTPGPDTGGGTPVTPEPGTTPEPGITLPTVPECFPTAEDQTAFIKRVLLLIDDLESALGVATPEMRATARKNLDDAYLILNRAKNMWPGCGKPKEDDDDEPHISIGIGIGVGGDHHGDDSDRDRHRPRPDDGDRRHD